MAKCNAVTGTTMYLPEGAVPPAPGEVPAEVQLVGPGAPTTDADVEEGEQPSPGSSSSASTGQPESSDEPSSPSPPRRARTTGRRSPKAQTESSGAPSDATTSGPETDAEGAT